MNVTHDQILNALKQVNDPDLNRDIVNHRLHRLERMISQISWNWCNQFFFICVIITSNGYLNP